MSARASAGAFLGTGGGVSPARYVRTETGISVVVNLLLAAAFTALLLPGGPARLWGTGGGMAMDFIPATFMPVLGMTAALTVITHKRRDAGKVQRLAAAPWRVPHHPLARGLFFGLIATPIMGGVGLLLLAALWPLPTSSLVAFKLAYGAAIGLCVTPFVLIAALRDRPPAADHSPEKESR